MNISDSIYFAQPADLAEILALCALHAAYEKLPFRMNGQESQLREDLFSENPKLYCLVAKNQQKIIAYATYMKQYATWEATEYIYMDCLFVLKAARSKGTGKALVERIKKESENLGCNLIQWQTPSFNKRAIKFYQRIGAYSKNKERFFLNI
ncbi:MAG: GNAT family N-acetyltransferase [Bacteroidota bacterium]